MWMWKPWGRCQCHSHGYRETTDGTNTKGVTQTGGGGCPPGCPLCCNSVKQRWTYICWWWWWVTIKMWGWEENVLSWIIISVKHCTLSLHCCSTHFPDKIIEKLSCNSFPSVGGIQSPYSLLHLITQVFQSDYLCNLLIRFTLWLRAERRMLLACSIQWSTPLIKYPYYYVRSASDYT